MGEVYWINGVRDGINLGVTTVPMGGKWLEEDIEDWKHQGVDVIVSMLHSDEYIKYDVENEGPLCEKYGIEFISFPIADHGTPDSKLDVESLLFDLCVRMERKKSVVVHCYAGIGRSPLIAACLLIVLGYDYKKAFNLISQARQLDVPDTKKQLEWTKEFQNSRNS